MTPVLLFCYNRPIHTAKTIASLVQNTECKDTELFVFVDGPKTTDEQQNVNKVIEVIKKIQGFKSVSVIVSKENKGLANSVITGVSEIIEKYEKIIVLEDDMLVTKDFLSFMNEALRIYQDNSLIASVSGYSFNPQIPSDYLEDVYLCKRASSWGWGTWKDRWQSVDWGMSDYNGVLSDKFEVNDFLLGGRDLLPMIVKYQSGIIDSWAIRWTFHHHLKNQYCLVPRLSKVQNIGTDGSGTNFSNIDNRYKVNFGEKDIEFPLAPQPNKKILQSFKEVYTPSLYRRILNFFKYGVF